MRPLKAFTVVSFIVLTAFFGFSMVVLVRHPDVSESLKHEGHPLALYVAIAVVSFLGTVVLVPVFRQLALGLGVLDHPDGDRKIHERSVPYLGGVPFYLVFLAVVLYLMLRHPEHSTPLFYPMAMVGALLVLMGLYDDICDMHNGLKLILEIGLISLLYFWGLKDAAVAIPFTDYTLRLGWLAFAVILGWSVAVINAINLTDGLDGLAAGIVLICAASVFAIGLYQRQVLSCLIMAYLMGTTLAFLIFNFNPARIFMGDTGALFLGFILGTTTLFVQQKGVTAIALAVPAVVLAVPILDAVLSIWRRLQRTGGGGVLAPDRGHLHHRLLSIGLSQRQVALTFYGISACMGAVAFVFSLAEPPWNVLIFFLATVLAILGVVVLRRLEGRVDRHQ